MANMLSWVNGLQELGNGIYYIPKNTIETYSHIESLGLSTVRWKSYTPDNVLSSLDEIKRFIESNNPCLFIFDPRFPGVKKSFLFGVKDFSEVEKWIAKNKNVLTNYNYLITTQIDNPGNGYVGSAYSDGNGRLFCETLHYPGISNQRELTQPTKDYDGYLSQLFIDLADSNEIWALSTDWLLRNDVEKIIKTFINHKGYFEFVIGVQHGKLDIYIIGQESGPLFSFPSALHLIGCNNPKYRIIGTILREGMG